MSMAQAMASADNEGQPSKSTEDSEEKSCPSRHKVSSKEDKKICHVCGDKALGYNFNVITCESCKAFFRRNAFKEKDVKCLFENKCLVDVRTRRFCPSCRLKKCYAMGMNPQMILDDREKKKRHCKVVANRMKRRLASAPESSPTPTVSQDPLLLQLKSEPVAELTQDGLSSDLGNFPTPSLDTTDSDRERPNTPIGKPHGDHPDEIFRHPTQDLIPTDPAMFYKFRQEEQDCLNNISKAYGLTLAAVPEVGPHSEKGEYQQAADLINFSEIAVRKLIIFVKYLDDFKIMNQADQIAILKSCVMNTLLLRSSLFYNIERDMWITPNSEMPSSILKSTTGFVDLHNSHVYYCRRVKSMAGNDLNLYALLQVLIVFDPAGKNISERQFVSTIQDRFLLLLKHYLESRYSYVFAKEYYVSAVDRLCDLKALSEEHAKIFLQVQPAQVEPLMLEVLNLK